jgi:hypothetical protein
MSQDLAPGHVEPEGLEEGPSPLTRRRFLQGIGAAMGVLAIGVVPAALTGFASASAAGAAGGATASAAELLASGDMVLDYIVAEDGSVNYPGHTVSYAPPPGDQKWAMVIDVKACVGCRRCVYA